MEQIADRFEVSRRTAERMLAALRRSVPELGFRSGPTGRRLWKIGDGFALPRDRIVEADLSTLESAAAALSRERTVKLAEELRTLARRLAPLLRNER